MTRDELAQAVRRQIATQGYACIPAADVTEALAPVPDRLPAFDLSLESFAGGYGWEVEAASGGQAFTFTRPGWSRGGAPKSIRQ
jgi:hypothetical protein